VPLHASTVEALRAYVQQRDTCFPRAKSTSFFISTAGTRLRANDVHRTFGVLVSSAGLEARGGRRPRLHDFRHRLATITLLDWYHAGVDVEAHLPLLSTFLGHAKPEHSYWYLSAVPELLALAAERVERLKEEMS
jgi:integrase